MLLICWKLTLLLLRDFLLIVAYALQVRLSGDAPSLH
jgi:hypothetical protein